MTESIWERIGPRHWRVTTRAAVDLAAANAENPYLRGLFGDLLLGPPDTSPMRQQEEIWRGFWGVIGNWANAMQAASGQQFPPNFIALGGKALESDRK